MDKMMFIDVDGKYVVEGVKYYSADAAYRAFRRLYDKSLGRAAKQRYDNLKPRKSLVTHKGMCFDEKYIDALNEELKDTKKVKCYILGILGISYGYMYGCWDFDSQFCDYDDDKRERYIDWIIGAGTNGVRMCGRMDRLVFEKHGKMMVGRYVSHKTRGKKAK